MSGNYPRILKRRTGAIMKNAITLFNEGEYDLAVLNAEYAAKVYIIGGTAENRLFNE